MTTSARVLTVRFSDVGEYLEELERDTFAVERKIVRLSTHAQASHGGVCHVASVRSGYIVEGRPIMLEHFVGMLWGFGDGDDATRSRAAEVVQRVQQAVEVRGLELRKGTLEIAEAEVGE